MVDESIWTAAPGAVEAGVSVRELLRWFEAWLDIGEVFATDKLIDLGEDFCALAFGKLLRVRAVSMMAAERDYFGITLAGHYLHPKQFEGWDALHGVLLAMWDEAPHILEAVLTRLSYHEWQHATSTRTGLEADAGFEREQRREQDGHVDTTTAAVFLRDAANADLDELLDATKYAPHSHWYLHRNLKRNEARLKVTPASETPTATKTADTDLDQLQRELEHYEFMQAQQQQLLEAPQGVTRSTLPLRQALAALRDEQHSTPGPSSFDERIRELSYLGNLLMTSICMEDKKLSEFDAANLAMATCNLGASYHFWVEGVREDTPTGHSLWNQMLSREPGLEGLFRVGWRLISRIPLQAVNALQKATSNSSGFKGERAWLAAEVQLLLPDLICACEDRNFTSARDTLTLLGVVIGLRTSDFLAPLLDEVPRLVAQQGEPARFIESMSDVIALDRRLANLGGAT
jgi:hypothetical protein